MEKYERPARGDLVGATYRGPWQMERKRGVAERVDGDVVELRDGTVLDIGAREYVSLRGRRRELYSTRVVVPAAQVRYPGVEAGDVVMFGRERDAHRVERVEDGVVHTTDGWARPVTQVTAFDEDVDDYDPLSLPPGWEGLF